MKTPEEIKKGLECCVTRYNCHLDDEQCCYHSGGVSCHYDVMKDALAYIQQLEAAQPKWIGVEERYPENEVPVLLHYKYGCTDVGYWYDGFAEWNNLAGEEITCPDFWMPLPEPPKEG